MHPHICNPLRRDYNQPPEKMRGRPYKLPLPNRQWSESIGSWSAKHPSIFIQTVNSEKGLVHDTIPPGAHTYQADIETAHGIIENEFYEIETFSSPQAFLAKATQYVTWFNVARINGYKGNKTPWEIIHERDPTISPQIAIFQAMSLDQIWRKKLARLTKGGYDLIPYPYFSLKSETDEKIKACIQFQLDTGLSKTNKL